MKKAPLTDADDLYLPTVQGILERGFGAFPLCNTLLLIQCVEHLALDLRNGGLPVSREILLQFATGEHILLLWLCLRLDDGSNLFGVHRGRLGRLADRLLESGWRLRGCWGERCFRRLGFHGFLFRFLRRLADLFQLRRLRHRGDDLFLAHEVHDLALFLRLEVGQLYRRIERQLFIIHLLFQFRHQ